jgi:hypothetical protein
MRIDYSEPKKSYSSPQPLQSRPRKEPSGSLFGVVAITAIISLIIGFGGGWAVSQRSAKKAFKAAMEQQSLENSPQPVKAAPAPQQPAVPAPKPAVPPQQASGSAPQPAASTGSQGPADPPLSFYKTLPSGQKSNVMGSGINSKEDKPAKQPLQAAMPANVIKASQPANNDDNAPKQPQTPQGAPIKPGSHPDSTGLTVQVGSYSLRSEAETLRSKLATKGYNVNIVESRLGDKGTWYRVRVGKKLDADAAKELAGKIGKGAIAVPDKD